MIGFPLYENTLTGLLYSKNDTVYYILGVEENKHRFKFNVIEPKHITLVVVNEKELEKHSDKETHMVDIEELLSKSEIHRKVNLSEELNGINEDMLSLIDTLQYSVDSKLKGLSLLSISIITLMVTFFKPFIPIVRDYDLIPLAMSATCVVMSLYTIVQSHSRRAKMMKGIEDRFK